MGKGGRIVCIATPMILTIASFICLVLIEIAGWSKGTLSDYYFFQANFTNLDVSSASTADNTTTLTAALEAVSSELQDKSYQIHLWNYCIEDTTNSSITYCSKRHGEYTFDPITVWGLNSTTTSSTSTSSDNPIESEIASVKNSTEELEDKVLGKSAKDALEVYDKVAHWMFIAYAISFWTTLATIVLGFLAIFSRLGSFLTWLMAFVSSIFTLAAVLTSTVLFGVLVGALKTVLDPYGVTIHLGTHALAVTWLSVVFTWAATLFWLFSVCCCSGRSNPHHRSNKGGLWDAEQKGQGYGGGMRVAKTGGSAAYEPLGDSFAAGGRAHDDRVPLQPYPQQQTFPQHAGYAQPSGAYEPFRRG